MHESIIIKKLDDISELIDICDSGIVSHPDNTVFQHVRNRINKMGNLLKKFESSPSEIINSAQADRTLDAFKMLKTKFDLYCYNYFKESKKWYIAAKIASEAESELDKSMLGQHILREALKKGFEIWEAVCCTNLILENDIVTFAEAERAKETLKKSGKLK